MIRSFPAFDCRVAETILPVSVSGRAVLSAPESRESLCAGRNLSACVIGPDNSLASCSATDTSWPLRRRSSTWWTLDWARDASWCSKLCSAAVCRSSSEYSGNGRDPGQFSIGCTFHFNDVLRLSATIGDASLQGTE